MWYSTISKSQTFQIEATESNILETGQIKSVSQRHHYELGY